MENQMNYLFIEVLLHIYLGSVIFTFLITALELKKCRTYKDLMGRAACCLIPVLNTWLAVLYTFEMVEKTLCRKLDRKLPWVDK
jgi:hypothetical protein